MDRKLIQKKYTANFLTLSLSLKGNDSKPSKGAAEYTFFLQCLFIGTACFDKCFLLHVIIRRH